jgi:hypothetical protein
MLAGEADEIERKKMPATSGHNQQCDEQRFDKPTEIKTASYLMAKLEICFNCSLSGWLLLLHAVSHY